jgi:hypothetical protein
MSDNGADEKEAGKIGLQPWHVLRFGSDLSSADGQAFNIQGWARALSESDHGTFLAHDLPVGELVTLNVPSRMHTRKRSRLWLFASWEHKDSSGVERTERDSILPRKKLITWR